VSVGAAVDRLCFRASRAKVVDDVAGPRRHALQVDPVVAAVLLAGGPHHHVAAAGRGETLGAYW
jgi:hypothetical protein